MRPTDFPRVVPSSRNYGQAQEMLLSPYAWAHGGHTVARTDDGRVVFVRHADVGELVRVRVTDHDPKAAYWRADTVEVVEAAEHRREHHPWAAADATLAAGETPVVGGAELGHLVLERQRAIKTEILVELLGRIGAVPQTQLDALDPQVVAMPDEHSCGLQWRTRAHFGVDRHGVIAMHPHRDDQLVAVDDFPLMVPQLRQLRLAEVDFRGVSRVDVAAPSCLTPHGNDPHPESNHGPLIMLTPQDGNSSDCEKQAVDRVLTHVQSVAPTASVVLKAAAGQPSRFTVLAGEGHVCECVDRFTWKVSAGGFWQIHRSAPSLLLQEIPAAAELTAGQFVLDLYSGAGLLTTPLAHAVGETGHVMAVEGSSITSADAVTNARELDQVEVVCGAVDAVLHRRWPMVVRGPRGQRRRGSRKTISDVMRTGHKGAAPMFPDVVVLDPPRTGAGKSVVDAIHAVSPRRVVYLSCDPATVSRDVARFLHHGWHVESVKGFDMYPNTHHLETLVTLVR